MAKMAAWHHFQDDPFLDLRESSCYCLLIKQGVHASVATVIHFALLSLLASRDGCFRIEHNVCNGITLRLSYGTSSAFSFNRLLGVLLWISHGCYTLLQCSPEQVSKLVNNVFVCWRRFSPGLFWSPISSTPAVRTFVVQISKFPTIWLTSAIFSRTTLFCFHSMFSPTADQMLLTFVIILHKCLFKIIYKLKKCQEKSVITEVCARAEMFLSAWACHHFL